MKESVEMDDEIFEMEKKLKKMHEQISRKASAKKVAHLYCQTEDGTVYEVPFNTDSYYNRITARIDLAKGGMPFGATIDREEYHLPHGTVVPPELGGYSVANTDVTILPYNSVKALEEILKSNPNDFLEKIIDPETYKPTDLGAKIIRNINPNEEDAQKLYKSLKTIEKRAEWFDPSRLLGYSDVDGDPATIVASVLKESIKGSMHSTYTGASSCTGFKFDKRVPKEIETLMETIFKGYTSCSDYPGNDEKIKKRILTIISFFVEFADLLLNQQ